jgi:hypothetical protein
MSPIFIVWTSVVILVGLAVALFVEGRRSRPGRALPLSAVVTATLSGAVVLALLMQRLWVASSKDALLLFGSLMLFGCLVLTFGSRRSRMRG